MLYARSIILTYWMQNQLGKNINIKRLHHWAIYRKDCSFLGSNKEVQKASPLPPCCAPERWSIKKVLQYSQKNTCVGDFRPVTIKRDSNTCFPVNIAKSLRTPSLRNNSGWLLLEVESENISRWWLTYSLQERYRKIYCEKHLLRLLSVSRKRGVDVQNVLYRELFHWSCETYC